jgi:hypothetical protein
MRQKRRTTFFCILCSLAIIGVAACGGSNGGGGSNPGEGDSATLSTTDFPTTGICATGSTDVTVQALLDMLGNATQVEFQHKPYNNDDANIPFICGLNAVWDPSDGNAFGASTIFATTTPVTDITGQLLFGAIYLCNTGFGFQPGAAATAGLHEAETYRAELILTDAQANQIRIRIRFTVSGPDAGATLASLGLSSTDFTLQDSNGNNLAAVSDVLALFAADAGSVTVNLVSNSTTHITALGRVVCWEQQ